MRAKLAEYTIKRLNKADTIADDVYALIDPSGELVNVFDWQQARQIMLGKIAPSMLTNVDISTAVDD